MRGEALILKDFRSSNTTGYFRTDGKDALARFALPPVPPILSGSHSGNALEGRIVVLYKTKIIELPGRSELVSRLEGRCRRQAANGYLYIYIFFRLTIGCRVDGRFLEGSQRLLADKLAAPQANTPHREGAFYARLYITENFPPCPNFPL